MVPPAWLASFPPLERLRFKGIANLFLLPSAGSTNDVAKAFVEKMLSDDSDILPTAFVTRTQTAGRGRAGRSWTTLPASGVAISLVIPWPEDQPRVRLPVTAGIVLARSLSELFGVDVRLKWPNDLLVGRLKLGGILVEARSNEDGAGYAVVGVGLNLTSTREQLDEAGLTMATSLALESAEGVTLLEPEPVRTVLLALDGLVAAPVLDLPSAFAEVSAHAPGDALVVRTGDRIVEGSFVGVTEDGLLRLSTKGGEAETLVSGDVLQD